MKKILTFLIAVISLASCSGRGEPYFEHGIAVLGEMSRPMIVVINNESVTCVFVKGFFGAYESNSHELAWWPAQMNGDGNWIVDTGVPGKCFPIVMKIERLKSNLVLSETKDIPILEKFISPDQPIR